MVLTRKGTREQDWTAERLADDPEGALACLKDFAGILERARRAEKALMAQPSTRRPAVDDRLDDIELRLAGAERRLLKTEVEQKGFNVNPTERRVLMNLFDTIDKHGKFIANDKEGPKAAVGRVVVDWRDYQKVAELNEQLTGDEARKDFVRVKASLVKYGILGTCVTYLWWSGKPIHGFERTFPKKENFATAEDIDAVSRKIEALRREIDTAYSRGYERGTKDSASALYARSKRVPFIKPTDIL